MKAVSLACFVAVTSLALGAHAVGSAELYRSASYQYGRFEARIQFAPGDGVVSSFFLWKNGSEVAGTFWNELDFEKLGADCHLQTNALFGSGGPGDHGQQATLSSSLCDQFHTYTYEWTPDYIAWLVDGVEIRRETGDIAAAYAQNATAGMQLRFNVWPGDVTFGGNFNPSILPVYEYINWVQYSSYTNGAFQFQWREDFTAASTPSGWLTANWSSPKALSTHTPRNIGYVNGYAVIALTADDAMGVAGVTPNDATDSSGGTGSNSNPTTGTGGAGGQAAATNSSANQVAPEGEAGCGCHLVPTRSAKTRSLGAMGAMLLGAVLVRRRRSARNGLYSG